MEDRKLEWENSRSKVRKANNIT